MRTIKYFGNCKSRTCTFITANKKLINYTSDFVWFLYNSLTLIYDNIKGIRWLYCYVFIELLNISYVKQIFVSMQHGTRFNIVSPN